MGSNSRPSPLVISPSANMIFTVDRILNYSNECCHKQGILHWKVHNKKNIENGLAESCYVISKRRKLHNVFGVKFASGIEAHRYNQVFNP